jgi:Prolyl oligopeptidase family
MKSFLHFSAVSFFAFAAALALRAAEPVPSPAPVPGSAAASLSPDGKYLAYSVRDGEKTRVVTVEIDRPEVVKASIVIGTDDSANSMFSSNDEKTPLVVMWMGWVTPNRLVVMTNQASIIADASLWRNIANPVTTNYDAMNGDDWLTAASVRSKFARMDSAPGWSSSPGTLIAMDADGKNASVILNSAELTLEIPPSDPFVERSSPDQTSPYKPFPGLSRGPHVAHPNFFDFSNTDPESIVIRAQLSSHITYFCNLNVVTGKVKLLNREAGNMGYMPLYDRQGRTRGGIERDPTSYPVNYVLQKEGFTLGRWENLDEVVATQGKNQFSISPANYFTERSFPLGFDENPDILYYASNVSRDTYGVYSLNVKTGQPTDFAAECPDLDLVRAPGSGFSSALVFDRYDRKLVGLRFEGTARLSTRWLRPELLAAQKKLEDTFPRLNVEILEWDRSYTRFLALVHGVANPGSFVVYRSDLNRAFDVVRRSKLYETGTQHRVMPVSIKAADGHQITGVLTFPASGRFQTVPVVVRCPTQPWLRAPLDYQPESMALADMGFAVLQIDSRGAWGFGVKRRESIKEGYEKTIVDDIIVAIDILAKTYRINPQRVALLCEGYGGFVALRALQLEPNRFRCAATINAPLDLYSWIENDRWTRRSKTGYLTQSYYGSTEALKEAPLVRHPENITKPVCLLAWPGPDGAPRT